MIRWLITIPAIIALTGCVTVAQVAAIGAAATAVVCGADLPKDGRFEITICEDMRDAVSE